MLAFWARLILLALAVAVIGGCGDQRPADPKPTPVDPAAQNELPSRVAHSLELFSLPAPSDVPE